MDVLETFCNQDFQLMMVYIPIYHCIMKLKQIQKNELSIRVHFHFTTTLSQCYNYKKDYKGLDLIVVYLWNFAHVKREPQRKIFFTKILNFFSSCEVHIRCFFKKLSTLCYNNMKIVIF